MTAKAVKVLQSKKSPSLSSEFSIQRGPVFALALLAAIGVHLLRLHGCGTPLWLNLEAGLILSVCLSALLYAGTQSHRTVWNWIGGVCVCLPLFKSMLQARIFGESGEATELVWLAMLQATTLWLSSVARSRKEEWTCFLLSSFLMIFGLATSDRSGMVVIVVAYGLLAAWWLMAKYWQSIARGFVANESVPLIRLRSFALLFALTLTGLFGVLAWNLGLSLAVVDGFMPTSGGTGQSDPSARNGVGDGDMLIAAKDQAFTFGPVESDLFLDSKTPSLYDLISDFYGEPLVKREMVRTISLDSNTQEAKEEGSESKKRSREFSAVRKPSDKVADAKLKGTESRALIHLIGRVPQHLRLETYDHFDGMSWSQSQEVQLESRMGSIVLDAMNGNPWMQLQVHPAELVHPIRERQTLKVIGLKSPRIATPSLLTHTYIDKVDRPDFFGWTPDGQLNMPNRDHVPQLTVIHQLYQMPQLHPLRDTANRLSQIAKHTTQPVSTNWLAGYFQLAHQDSETLPEVATRLIEKQCDRTVVGMTDWQKVEGLVEALRIQFQHAPHNAAPADCSNVVEHFIQTKSGPDYLFATTAVTLIRSLNIPSRMVTGFYASPEHYDPKSGQTEILPEHLHTWAEVYCHGVWLPIEPTPGFAKPNEHRSWGQWMAEMGWFFRDLLYFHPIRNALWLCAIFLVVLLRQRIADASLSLIFLPSLMASLPLRVRWTNRLLGWKAWVYGRRFPVKCTLAQRLESQLQNHAGLSVNERVMYIHAVEHIAYAPKVLASEWLRQNAAIVRQACWAITSHGCRSLFTTPFIRMTLSKK